MGVVHITDAARGLRRSLGPTAWAVLEDLTLDARLGDDGAAVAVSNVRTVAEHLGLNKDTVGGAIHVLVAAGLVLQRPQHTDRAGRFGPAVYHLRLPPGVALGPCPPHPDTAVPTTARRVDAVESVAVTQTRRQPANNNHQLNLLEPNA